MKPFEPAVRKGLTEEAARWLIRHALPHEPALRKWLASRRLPGLEIDDVVQETYARLIQTGNMNIIENTKAYMFLTARSVLVTHVRRRKVVDFQALADVDEARLGADSPSPEDQAADRDELMRFAKAIATLPPKIADVFVLRRLHGYSQKETAARLGLAESTVEKHMRRGLLLLFERFMRSGYQPPKAYKLLNKSVQPDHGQSVHKQDR